MVIRYADCPLAEPSQATSGIHAMELDHVEAFVAIVRRGGFTRARLARR